MAFKYELKELFEALGWLFQHRMQIADARTVSEQFDRTKKISDFVGFLARLMFLAAIQAIINETSKNTSIPWQIIYGFVGAIILIVQAYLSYSISFIVTKVTLKTLPVWLGIDMNFQLGRNRQTVIFFAVLAFLQVLYFGVNSTIQEAVSRGTATVSAQHNEDDNSGQQENSQSSDRHNVTN